MSWLQSVSFLASAAVSLLSCHRAPALQMSGETTRLMRGEAAPRESAVFDGQTLRLRGARGETLGLQVRMSEGSQHAAVVILPPSVAAVTAFVVSSLEVRQPSSRLYGESRGRGTYPDILSPQADGTVPSSELAYFDIEIRGAAAPGTYHGELMLDGTSVPVTLDVSRARIDADHDPLVWAFYLPKEIARVHGLADDDSPSELATERTYYDLFRAHGVMLAADLPPARFASRERFVRDVRYWPVGIDITSDDAIADDVHHWLALFEGLDATPFAIPIDEPHTPAQKARARHIADVIGQAGGGRPRLLRGVTDVVDDDVYADAIDVFISPKNLPALAHERQPRGERFWTYNGRPPEAGSMVLDAEGVALRTWGWIAYRYDIELWYAWEALYFSDRYNGGGPTDVMRDPITFDERRKHGDDWGNGDGLLAYPGPRPSIRLKALRRGLQDRLLLRELESCGGGEVARRISRRMIPRALSEAGTTPAWPTLETTWEEARGEVLDAIEATCP
jgi:hypothetical protein